VHANEVRATPEQVGRLIAKQFPEWAGLPLAVLDRQGTDHVLFGSGMSCSSGCRRSIGRPTKP
jgi:hypothetical protein